jgi:hypothetical protein
MKHTVHVFTKTQHCWQHYATHPHCQPFFPISAFFVQIQNILVANHIEVFTSHLAVRTVKSLPHAALE